MNLKQLAYIVAVDQLKNFSKAAEYCDVTQATLSAMIKKFEVEIDMVIFDRKANPIVTTDCGKEIVFEARKVIHHANSLLNLAKNFKMNVSGSISLGIIPTIANSLLPKMIKPLMEKYPDLEMEIRELTTDEIVKALGEGRLDAGIATTPLKNDDIEENILYYEMLMVYGSTGKDKKYILPEEITESKIWMLEEGHCLREQFIHLCSLNKKRKLPRNLKFEANSFETLLNMVDSFGGLTLIPELYYETLSTEKQQKVSFFKSPIPVREVSLIYFRPFAKHRIIEILTEEIKQMVGKSLRVNDYKKSELVIAQP